MTSRARSVIEDTSQWLVEAALPFWAENGPDTQYGGFVEELTFSGKDAALPYKRVRVTCRQMYVFSHAAIKGWSDGADLIAHAADYLTEKAWLGDDKGFARRLTRRGAPLDPTPDLYEHAFALFAFSWAYKATKDSAYSDWAFKTLDWIEANFRDTQSAGFWHHLPQSGDRLQNPHMHLLEACVSAYDIFQDARFQAMGIEVATLFKNRFFNSSTGVLGEYFNDQWVLVDGHKGRITEPGHQLEWVWILNNCKLLFDFDADQEADAMFDFSERHGLNGYGAVKNRITNTGAVIDAGSRTWPNSERLKAAAARHGNAGYDASPIIESTGRLLLNRYLSSNESVSIPRGGWIDAFDEHGAAIARHMPASTFYHLFLAFSEIEALSDI